MKNKIAGLLMLVLLSPLTIFAHGARWDGNWGNPMGFMGRSCVWNGQMGFMGGGFMMIIWIILLGLIVVGILRWIFPSKFSSGKTAGALSILAERYAKGEISEDEFKVMKNALR